MTDGRNSPTIDQREEVEKEAMFCSLPLHIHLSIALALLSKLGLGFGSVVPFEWCICTGL